MGSLKFPNILTCGYGNYRQPFLTTVYSINLSTLNKRAKIVYMPSPTLSTRWLTEEMSLHFPFTIDTITAGAMMS